MAGLGPDIRSASPQAHRQTDRRQTVAGRETGRAVDNVVDGQNVRVADGRTDVLRNAQAGEADIHSDLPLQQRLDLRQFLGRLCQGRAGIVNPLGADGISSALSSLAP
jgi:hypothetical protein